MICRWLYIALIVAAELHLLLQRRDPYRTLLWGAALLLLPGLGLLAYWLVGRDMRHRQLIADDLRHRLDCRLPSAPSPLSHPDQQQLASLLLQADGTPLAAADSLELYTDCGAAFDELMRDIAAAQHHIHIEFFKIEDDAVGNVLADLLVSKAQAGVEVRLIYDHAANLGVGHRFYRRMAQGGVDVQPFLPLWSSLLRGEANFRNHRKIVVIDAAVGYTGGLNIAQRYRDGIRSGIWRDTFVRLTGVAVGQLQRLFAIDWHFCSSRLLDAAAYYPVASSVVDGPLMQVVANNPWGAHQAVKEGILQLVTDSRRYLYVQSPYLIPDASLLASLKMAALRGVEVRIMIPAQPDKGYIVHRASESYFAELMAAGVHIYQYHKGYMHAKTLVSDDRTATVGSTNIDIRSLELDFEVNCFVYDDAVAVRMRRIFEQDLDDCTRVDPAQWQQRSYSVRLKENLSRLLAPAL